MRALPQSLQTLLFPLLLLTTAPRPTHAFTNDFSAYPSGSQDCLTSSADSSGCDGDTGTEMNQCLCTNGGNFIYNTASCVAKASPSDLQTVYATLENNCAGTGVIITVGEAAFLAQASAARSSTIATATGTTTGTSAGTSTTGTGTGTAATTTSTSSSSSSATSTPSSDGMSTGAKIGLGAGIGLASVGLILAAVWIWVYNRRRRPTPGERGEYIQTASPLGEYSGTFDTNNFGTNTFAGASTFGSASPHPNSAIPLSAVSGTSGWRSSGGAEGMYYKPQDAQQSSAAGQPLLAELDNSAQVAPVELYAPPPGEFLVPGTGTYGVGGYHAELSAAQADPARYQSPPGSHSPYSPPYERSHF